MSHSESLERFAEILDIVVDNCEEVVITREGRPPVVIISFDHYESMQETAYLMRSPANARRLLESMERLEAGQGIVRDLVE